ncbi:MAG: flavin reductase [Planctomycetales bacterium]|nr:flavin reductase [Planctomycetales bacterium]
MNYDKHHTAVAQVLGRIPSGIFVLTIGDDSGRETGMLASWVQQASFDPPQITIAVKRERYVNQWLPRRPFVILNLLGDSDKNLLGHFGRGFKEDEPAFQGIELARGPVTGLPCLTEALGYIECRAISHLDAGDHVIHLLEILGAGLGESLHEESPMVHVRKSGLTY